MACRALEWLQHFEWRRRTTVCTIGFQSPGRVALGELASMREHSSQRGKKTMIFVELVEALAVLLVLLVLCFGRRFLPRTPEEPDEVPAPVVVVGGRADAPPPGTRRRFAAADQGFRAQQKKHRGL
ncbi:hypothetical protein LTR17_016224 [Elasticomyces elasticus]|nr:hypothetical protein LTR17_016224 [Elasticomyces elasticus]